MQKITSIFLLFLIILVSTCKNSTDSDEGSGLISWQKEIGTTESEYCNCVSQTADTGYFCVSWRENPGFGSGYFYLIKLNNLGDTLWTKIYGNGFERANYGQETQGGGYIIVGTQSSSSSSMIHLIKTDMNGNMVWEQLYYNSGWLSGYYIEQLTDGGYFIIGSATSGISGMFEIYIMRTNGTGVKQWDRSFSTGISPCLVTGQVLEDGYIIVAGPLIKKLNSSGNVIWEQNLGDRDCQFVRETLDNGFIVIAKHYLIKTDSWGNKIWEVFLSYDGNCIDLFDDGFIIATEGDCLITDGSGNIINDLTFPMTDATSVKKTLDGGFILGGFKWTDDLNYNVYIVKN